MHLVAEREGVVVQEDSLQDKFLEWMYTHKAGRVILRPLISPAVSRLGGRLLDSKVSRFLVAPFIRSHSIDMSRYEKRRYLSYNDFFTRRLIAGGRAIEKQPDKFISPCDGRLGVYEINGLPTFSVKHGRYTVSSLLRNRKLADRYAGGYIWIFRLCVEDYHRYIYVDNGKVSKSFRILGVFHTVNPAACDRFPVYKENTREYSVLKSENFGEIVQMEVGAMLVGRIENHPGETYVKRGQEKGNFAFGGSTVILITRAGRVKPDKDILDNSARGIETRVKLGERIGEKICGDNNPDGI
ncbi:MAG: phosphatidylserine decarboxylase [Dorea sp.]|nr:phosphatidylserine decarboxylase [Dorea sp.]